MKKRITISSKYSAWYENYSVFFTVGSGLFIVWILNQKNEIEHWMNIGLILILACIVSIVYVHSRKITVQLDDGFFYFERGNKRDKVVIEDILSIKDNFGNPREASVFLKKDSIFGREIRFVY